jgi:hypothetical protein
MELLPKDCPICNHSNKDELEVQCLKGKITKRDISEIVGCRVDDVWEHMTNHMRSNNLTELNDKRNVLLDSVNKLRESLDHVAETRSFNPAMTKQLTDLAKELRQTIIGLAELEGGMRKEQHITIEQYNDFRSIIIAQMAKLCPKCQQILMEELEKEENEPKPPVINVQYRDKSLQRPRVLRQEYSEDESVSETS